jgi:hypothetical protein
MNAAIDIEGYAPDELLALPNDLIDPWLFRDAPVVFRVGTATLLAEFRRDGTRLVLELAQIDGGGEGILPLLSSLAEAFARGRRYAEIEWIVHARTCARPNERLRRILDSRGFEIIRLSDGREVYRRVISLSLP